MKHRPAADATFCSRRSRSDANPRVFVDRAPRSQSKTSTVGIRRGESATDGRGPAPSAADVVEPHLLS
jgi:hypothetical protein